MFDYLIDKNFLKQLDAEKHRVIYARVMALNKNGQILEVIEGKINSGTLNVDAGANRRSCSLSLSAVGVDLHEYYWTFKTHFSFEIGIENNINSSYPSICWFK